jgi:hypothetical protein
MTSYSPPPTHFISIYSIIIHTGKGGQLSREKGRGAIVTKQVENINMTDCISSI